MPDYYDRQGNPISLMEWAQKFEESNRIVKQTRHKEKGREFWLSTVWLGLDHNFFESGPPLIFETMALEFKPTSLNQVVAEDRDWFYQERYSTEEEAIEGHNPWNAVTIRWVDPIKSFFDRFLR